MQPLFVAQFFVSCPAPARVMLAHMSARSPMGSLSTAPTARRLSFALISRCVNFVSVLVLGLAGNGLALGALADCGAQNCHYSTKFDAR